MFIFDVSLGRSDRHREAPIVLTLLIEGTPDAGQPDASCCRDKSFVESAVGRGPFFA